MQAAGRAPSWASAAGSKRALGQSFLIFDFGDFRGRFNIGLRSIDERAVGKSAEGSLA